MREISLDRLRTWSPSPTWAPSPTPRAPCTWRRPPSACARGRPGGAGGRGAAHAHARAGAPHRHRRNPAGPRPPPAGRRQPALDDAGSRGWRAACGWASTGAIAHLLPQALETLARDHPRIDVQVAVLTSQETLLRLADGTLDLGIVALPQPPMDGMVLRPWRRDPVLAFLPASWRAPSARAWPSAR